MSWWFLLYAAIVLLVAVEAAATWRARRRRRRLYEAALKRLDDVPGGPTFAALMLPGHSAQRRPPAGRKTPVLAVVTDGALALRSAAVEPRPGLDRIIELGAASVRAPVLGGWIGVQDGLHVAFLLPDPAGAALPGLDNGARSLYEALRDASGLQLRIDREASPPPGAERSAP